MLLETLSVKLVGDVTDFAAKMNTATSAIVAVGDKMQAVGQRMQAIGQQWSLYISAPLIAIGKKALDSAADFEISMNVIEQVTGATTKQMAAMSKQALKLGKDTVFSANEAAEAQLELGKAGMAVNDIMQAMPGVLDLAAAGDVDLAKAAKLTASALNAFGLEAEQSAYVANLLAAAANASAADIQDLSLGFMQGGFAFAAAGQKVDDLAASLAILTNVGLKGTDAGTALKNMFTQMYGPTDKAAKVMSAYKIELFDAAGNMKPLADIIDVFSTRLGGLTQEKRLAVLETILLSDGMKAMIPLLAAGKDGFLAMKDAVNEEGAAADVANARMKGLSGAIEYFKGTIDTLMVQTATPWLNQIGDMIRSMADWIAKFGELDPAVQKNIVVMAALVAAVGPVLLYAGLLTQAIGAITTALGAMSVFIYANPIVALAALGLAMTAFSVAWANDWGGARDAAQAAFDYFQARWPELAEVTRDNATKIAGSINNIIGSLRDLFTYSRTTGPQINSAWGGIFGGIYTVTIRTVTAVTKSIELLLNAITAIQRAMDALTSGDWSGLATIKTDFDTLMRGMQGTLIEDLAKWMDPLYWIGLRPDLPTAAANTPLADILRERGLAGGGIVPTAGRYLVGEVGPEMVTLPAGAYVHSNRETSKMGGGVTITLNQVFNGAADRATVASGAQQGILQGLRQVGLA